jgi:hypothetical protein
MMEEHKFIIPDYKYTNYSLSKITLGCEKEKGFGENYQPFNSLKRYGRESRPDSKMEEKHELQVPEERPSSATSNTSVIKKVPQMELLISRRLKIQAK